MHWKRGTIALLLSVLQPGLGQVYNGQLRLGIAWMLFVPLTGLVANFTTIWSTFLGLAVFVATQTGAGLGVTAHAVVVALRRIEPAPKTARTGWAVALALTASNLAAAGSGFYTDRLPIRAFTVPSQSMSPTIQEGDRIIVNMKAYENAIPGRGDVIVFEQHAPGRSLQLKRVIALGGDTVEGTVDGVTLNGERLVETYLNPSIPAPDQAADDGIFGPVSVPAGKIFVLGDNREKSYDSRYFGPVELKSVRGRALFLYWSHDHRRISQPVR